MGFFGNILGEISEAVSGGIPIIGGRLGKLVGEQARRLPFKHGGMVVNPMIAHAKQGKGTKAMKDKMRRLRAMRKK